MFLMFSDREKLNKHNYNMRQCVSYNTHRLYTYQKLNTYTYIHAFNLCTIVHTAIHFILSDCYKEIHSKLHLYVFGSSATLPHV